MVGCDWSVGGSGKVVRMRVFKELRTPNDVGEEGWRWVAPCGSSDVILRLLALILIFGFSVTGQTSSGNLPHPLSVI